MASLKTVPGSNLLSRTQRHTCQGAKKIREINMILASLMLLLLTFHPVCGFADDKTDTSQAAESQTANSGQATDEAAPKEETKKDQSLEPIVVTATRTPQSISDVPAAVSVVTSEDIESRNIQKVDEALNELPGVFDQRVLPVDTTGFVMMRGMTGADRNLVLLDGEPLNTPFSGQVNWNSLNPLDIARIEVARGPFSSLYGGNAMGGVINIITKSPQEREVTVQSGYGSDNTYTEYASYGDKLYNQLSVFASFGYKQSNGYSNVPVVESPGSGTPPGTPVRGGIPSTDAYGNPAFIVGNTGDNNWWTQSASIKFVYDIDANSKAFFSYRNNQYGYGWGNPQSFLYDSSGNNIFSGNLNINGSPVYVNSSDFLAYSGGLTENIYHAGYETQVFGDAVLKISGGILVPEYWYANPYSYSSATHSGGAGQVTSTSSQTCNTDVQLSIPLLEKHLLIFGAAFRYDEAYQPVSNLSNWTNTGATTGLYSDMQGKDSIYSFYTQAEIALLHNLTLYAGARGDYWTTYDGMANTVGVSGYPQYYGATSDFSASPKGSLVYKPLDDTTFRTSIGTAFRPPTVYELYTSWYYPGIYSEANPNLKPEKSFSWDIGVEQKLPSSTVCKLNYFNNTISDYIDWALVSYTPSLSTYQNVNAGKAETNGMELEIETKPLDWLKLFTNATYTHSKMLSNIADPLSVGKQLAYVPEWMFNLGGELIYRKFAFTLTGRYVAKQYGNPDNTDTVSGVYGSYDAFFVADFKVSYKVTQWATLDFAINNMLDEKYFTYYQAPGRQFFGGITAKF